MSICKGKTKKGKQCKKKTKNKEGFCILHLPINISNIDCCVCYDEQILIKDLLNCNHAVCYTCISKLRNDTCPMCRQKLAGNLVTKEVEEKIKKNKENDKKENERINREAAINIQQNMNYDQVQLLNNNVYLFGDDVMIYADDRWVLLTRDEIIVIH
jgi:hypothetical protein